MKRTDDNILDKLIRESLEDLYPSPNQLQNIPPDMQLSKEFKKKMHQLFEDVYRNIQKNYQ
jgi:hypothetical protein